MKKALFLLGRRHITESCQSCCVFPYMIGCLLFASSILLCVPCVIACLLFASQLCVDGTYPLCVTKFTKQRKCSYHWHDNLSVSAPQILNLLMFSCYHNCLTMVQNVNYIGLHHCNKSNSSAHIVGRFQASQPIHTYSNMHISVTPLKSNSFLEGPTTLLYYYYYHYYFPIERDLERVLCLCSREKP